MRRARKKATGEVVAVKIISKSDLNAKATLVSEIAVLKRIDHPNVVHLYEVFEGKQKIYLVMEL